ncbi:MAG TPA: hypothetical protein VNH64_04150, partial [Parvularculaceae bacterium]|nr:hypothetical protein [Parvularculaceae bacterium]
MNVWIAPASDPGAARPITQETSRPIQRYSWSADGRYVLYAQDTAGDENFRLYAVDPRSGASRSFAPDRASRTDIYAVSPRKPNVVIVGVNDRDPDFFDIYAINLQTGERTKIFANTDGYDDFTFDNDLNLRLAYKDNPGGGGVLMRRAADGQWSPFQEIAPEDSLTTQPLSFNAAGDTLFWISSEGRDRAALRATNLDTGASRIIGENSKADVARALFDRTTFEPIAYDVDYLRNEWIGTSPAARRDLLFLSKRVKGDFNIISQTSDSRTWIVRVDSATSSPADYIFERAKRRLVKLFDERPGLNAYRLSAMEAVEIPSRDGLILPSYLTLPAAAGRNGGERTKQPGPLVLSVHGGPWARDEYGYQRFVQWLADRG